MSPRACRLGAALVVAVSVVACGGCSGTRTPGDAEPPHRQGSELSGAVAPAEVAAPIGVAAAAAVVVSTNEPFWQARVEGDRVTLTGVDSPERQFRIQSASADGAGRTIRASDAAGTLEIRIDEAPCQDDMSGARFPLGGTLTIDGSGPHRGCARPADMPPPRPPE